MSEFTQNKEDSNYHKGNIPYYKNNNANYCKPLAINVDSYKTILFNLQTLPNHDSISIQLMLARGHNKKDILTLFDTLHTKGFGIYDKGKRGRGHIAKFFPNNNCPQLYELKIKQKHRGKKKKLIDQSLLPNFQTIEDRLNAFTYKQVE